MLFNATYPHKSLRQLNEDASLDKYFLQHESVSHFLPGLNTTRSSTEEHEEDKPNQQAGPDALQVNQGEKRYRITFVKDSDAFKYLNPPMKRSLHDPKTRSRQHYEPQRNLESLFSGETSTIYGRSSVMNTTNIHRESELIFSVHRQSKTCVFSSSTI